MATIYLSSTYEDLKDYRTVVYQALRKAGHQVSAMEDYVAADQRPVDKCLRDVETADIYIGIFAFRYGYIPPSQHNNPQGFSITELEYRRAEALKRQNCLTFVVKDTTAWPRVFDDAYTAEDKGERIKALRQHLLTEKLASEFSEPHQLSALVLLAVTRHLTGTQQLESMNVQKSEGAPAITWNIDTQGSPYPGLDHLTKKYAPVFFGRDADVRAILDGMRAPNGRFVIVSGDSGTGKSSVIHAGVVPKIEQMGLPNRQQVLCVRMLPGQGRHPFAALMGALNPFATEAGLKPDDIAEELAHAPGRLGDSLQAILANGTACDALVLFLDQMEELFTTRTATASQQFLAALYKAVQEHAVWVLATIRSDHLHHCHNHPDMLTVLRGPGHYPLGPIEPFMLEDLIGKPARCAGLKISHQLVRRIVNETLIKAEDFTKPDQSNLPLLAFMLHELFEARSGHELSEDAYHQTGGVTGAVGKHAAMVEAELCRTQSFKADVLLPQLFKSLIAVHQLGVPTRRRPLLTELSPDLQGVVEVFVRKRLLRTEGEGNSATVSIIHEKLFEAWPSLKSYIDKNTKQVIDRTLLESRAKKWAEEGRSWHSGLASAREEREYCQGGVVLTKEMRAYLGTSERIRKLRSAAIAVLALMFLGLTWIWQKTDNLDQAMLKIRSLAIAIHHLPSAILLVRDSNQHDPKLLVPLDALNKHKLDERLNTLALSLIPDLKNRGKQGYESWATAQVILALLGLVEMDLAPRSSIVSFFVQDQMDSECNCWREISKPSAAKTAKHIANSAWVLYAMALLNERISHGQLQFLLNSQNTRGWWPMFPSGDIEENASTYATDWAVLALQEHVSRGLIEGEDKSKAIDAIHRGQSWLLLNRIPAKISWKDYPLSVAKTHTPEGKDSMALSALTLHVFHKINDTGHQFSLEEFDRMWLDSLPDKIPTSTEADHADRHINSLEGRVSEHVRYLRLPWMIIATSDAYPNGTFYQKVWTTIWVQRALEESDLLSEHAENVQNWNRAELVISLKHLIGKKI